MSAQTDLNRFVKKFSGALKDMVSKKNMKELGEYAISIIVKRTRGGKGLTSPTNPRGLKQLKPLSKRYVQQRAKASLDSSTSAKQSNLTYTGIMLRSMRVKNFRDGSVRIGPSDRKRKGGKTNSQIGDYVTDQGRPFNGLAPSEQKKLGKFYDANIASVVKRRL